MGRRLQPPRAGRPSHGPTVDTDRNWTGCGVGAWLSQGRRGYSGRPPSEGSTERRQERGQCVTGLSVIRPCPAGHSPPHGYDVAGLWHLVVDLEETGVCVWLKAGGWGMGSKGEPWSWAHLAERRGHLVGERPSNDHHIGLAWAGTENHAKAVHVIAGCRHVHHLHGTAGQAEGHGPHRALQGRVGSQ